MCWGDWHGKWASTQTPLLLLNGELDGTTPAAAARKVADRFTAPGQHYIEIPGAAHGTLVGSPLAGAPDDHCAMQLLGDFIDDPQGVPPDRCRADLLKSIDFGGTQELAQWAFARDSLWD